MDIVKDESDPEMRELARGEAKELDERRLALECHGQRILARADLDHREPRPAKGQAAGVALGIAAVHGQYRQWHSVLTYRLTKTARSRRSHDFGCFTEGASRDGVDSRGGWRRSRGRTW